jgi:hypothetical protein
MSINKFELMGGLGLFFATPANSIFVCQTPGERKLELHVSENKINAGSIRQRGMMRRSLCHQLVETWRQMKV